MTLLWFIAVAAMAASENGAEVRSRAAVSPPEQRQADIPAPTTRSSVFGAIEQDPLHQYGLDTWGEAQGLPQTFIWRIIQAKDGYIWMATKVGLVRFDGVSFTIFGSKPGELNDRELNQLVEAPDGVLWVAQVAGGIASFKDGSFKRYTTADGLPSNAISSLDVDRDGNLWIGTPEGACRYSHGTFTTFTEKDGLSGRSVIVNAASATGVVVSAGGRLHRFINGRFVVDGTLASGQDGGALWIVYEDAVLVRLKDGVATRYTRAQGVPTNILMVLDTPDGASWVAAIGGLYRWVEDRFAAVTSVGGEPITGSSLLMDKEGSLWLGTSADGLVRFRLQPLVTIGREDGLPANIVQSVVEDSQGRVVVGAQNGLAILQAGRSETIRQYPGGSIARVYSLAEDPRGRLWIASETQLLLMQGARLAPHPLWTPSAHQIRVLYRDRFARMWVGSNGDGIFLYDRERVLHFRSEDGLGGNQIRSLYCDLRGALWIGTLGQGLTRYAGGKFTTYTVGDGLPNDTITAISEDEDGALYFATRGGLCRLKDGRFHAYRKDDGLYSDLLSGIVDDLHGNLWFASADGIFYVSRKDLREHAAGKIKTLQSVAFGVRDGMRTSACTAGHQPTASRMRDGRLLFATMKGLVIVDRSRLRTNPVPPAVHIERVQIDGQDIAGRSLVDAPPGRGELEIHYTGLSFLAPEKVRFRYRLDGFDREWVDPGQRRFAHYAGLPPGSYTFRVLACNNDGVWSRAEASFAFRLKPHFYQTYWLYGLVLAVAATLVAATVRIRERRLKARARELARLVDEAVANVKRMRGLLPICASCKKIRDDKGYWALLETYIQEHSEAEFTHGLCPQCIGQFFPRQATKTNDQRA
jgi:ligand-binding sensor domain-containing protein